MSIVSLKKIALQEISKKAYNSIRSVNRYTMSDQEEYNFKETAQNSDGAKPKGLWYGIGSSWIDWVRSEMPDWESNYLYEVTLHEDRILKMSEIDELNNFYSKYKNLNKGGINWKEVAKEYSGIEISPYVRGAGYKHNWYYWWDVASGCIWSKNAIAKIDKVEL